MLRWYVFVALSALLASSGARSEPIRTDLVLDPLSFLSIGGETFSLPSETRIPVRFEALTSNGSASFVIHPDDVTLPAVPLRTPGEVLRFGLAAPAKGVLRLLDDGTATMSVDLRVRVQLDRAGESGMREVSLRLTTEGSEATSVDGSQTRSVTGMRLDSSSRAVQLVGTTTNATRDHPGPGAAVEVVLSGRFEALPRPGATRD